MPTFTMRAEVARFDGTKWTQDLDDKMFQLFIEAGRLFMLEINRRIPVRTGFLRGAFTTLEDLVGVPKNTGQPKNQRLPVKAESIRNKFNQHRNEAAALASKAENLRRAQARRIARIAQLRTIERRRTADLASTIERYQADLRDAGGHGLAIRRAMEERDRAFAEIRRQAIADRSVRTKLIRASLRDAKELQRIGKRLRQLTGRRFDRPLIDIVSAYNARIEHIEKRREQRFFRTLRNLDRQVNGYTDRRTGQRVAPTIDHDEYQRRLTNARARLNGRSAKIEQIREKIKAATGKRKDQIRDVLIERAKRRADKLKKKVDIRKAREQAEAYVRRAERSGGLLTGRINRGGDRLLQLSAQATSAEGRRHLQELLARAEKKYDFSQSNLNTLVRVRLPDGRYRIRRLNADGSTPRNAVSYLNEKQKDGTIRNQYLEYYKPEVGAKVLKTPRSGRQFATPTSQIIRKEQNLQGEGQDNVFANLVRQLQAIGIKPKESVLKAAKFGVKTPTAYTFNYNVDIHYLKTNDINLAWQSWASAMNIFRHHIETQALRKVPPLEQYILTGTLYQSPTTISRPFR